jgi:DNA-binding transcriptional LysR family regulator
MMQRRHADTTDRNRLSTSDRKVDMYDGQFDLALRIRQLPDSELKARRIGELRVVTFGAPAYFSKYGRPEHPKDVERHECIVRSSEPEPEKWWFRIRGKSTPVRVSGRCHTDDTASMHVAVTAGLGIGMAPLWQIRPLLVNRRVEIILEISSPPSCRSRWFRRARNFHP